MKKLTVLLIAVFCGASATAHDFSAKYKGKKIYYNITSSVKPLTVEVTFKGEDSGHYYSGNVSIPRKVKYGGKRYSVTAIGEESFLFCSELTSVIIPKSVTAIGKDAFWGCYNLTSINIPSSVVSIEDGVLTDCNGLTSITIPNSITSIGRAFENCIGLTSVTIPNSVTSIKGFSFWGCYRLESISISNSITSIEAGLFRDCRKLASIDIPNSIVSIGDWAFGNCTGLQEITVNWEAPLSVSKSMFFEVDTQNIRLIIPNGTYELYSNAEVWKDFKIEEVGE